jgi:hypothetical protein
MAINLCGNGSSGFPTLEDNKVGMMVLVNKLAVSEVMI